MNDSSKDRIGNAKALRRVGLCLLFALGVLSTLATGGGGGTATAPPSPDDEPPALGLIWDQGDWNEVEWQ